MRPWAQRHSLRHQQMLEALEQHYRFSIHTPFKDLAPEVQEAILYGSRGAPSAFSMSGEGGASMRPGASRGDPPAPGAL